MLKTVKHKERKNQVLDAAEVLFLTKGYAKTTINDVLKSVDIAKGTFYHYFDSKEEVMKALILRHVDRNLTIVNKIVDDPSLTAVEKLKKISSTDYSHTQQQIAMTRIQKVENAQMHLNVMVEVVQKFVPIMTKIVKQGIAEKTMKTDYPKESMELLMTMYQFIFSGDIFTLSTKEAVAKAKAYANFMECILSVKSGTFDFMYKVYETPHRQINLLTRAKEPKKTKIL